MNWSTSSAPTGHHRSSQLVRQTSCRHSRSSRRSQRRRSAAVEAHRVRRPGSPSTRPARARCSPWPGRTCFRSGRVDTTRPRGRGRFLQPAERDRCRTAQARASRPPVHPMPVRGSAGRVLRRVVADVVPQPPPRVGEQLAGARGGLRRDSPVGVPRGVRSDRVQEPATALARALRRRVIGGFGARCSATRTHVAPDADGSDSKSVRSRTGCRVPVRTGKTSCRLERRTNLDSVANQKRSASS
ncbi:hypothetical protein SAMN05421507_12247 [Lentzea jiangxiensis]|uniref:Uncharacterized protein n=1 Tax=Lentzea jiangxiensis TaxID=641025 RepID=A0A1H0WSA8_9PSEU|nr:hypothetical protein SAMN05421507_12247 [Lentzea jiangxiensis]